MKKWDLMATAVIASILLFVSFEAHGQACRNSADCDDGLWCNGREVCWLFGGCRPSIVAALGGRCRGDRVCLEGEDRCAPRCVTDADCDDGLFCNGEETCRFDGTCDPANEFPCLAGEACAEDRRTCGECALAPDADGDGFDGIACGGADCDDNDPNRYPGNTEVCDPDDYDEDCDRTTFGERDVDGDGYIDSACCNDGRCGRDCDDLRRETNPMSQEICNGLDDDCNGDVDEDVAIEMYPDVDRDLFGEAGGETVLACVGAPYLSIYDNDCNDLNPAITPGSIVCDPSSGPNAVWVCGSDGVYGRSKCAEGVCVTLPNGSGHCEVRVN